MPENGNFKIGGGKGFGSGVGGQGRSGHQKIRYFLVLSTWAMTLHVQFVYPGRCYVTMAEIRHGLAP